MAGGWDGTAAGRFWDVIDKDDPRQTRAPSHACEHSLFAGVACRPKYAFAENLGRRALLRGAVRGYVGALRSS